jgi:hypothetical protein
MAAGTTQAATWTEVGDAGELLPTSQTTFGSGLLDSISGTLIDLGDEIDDIDLYQIFIHDTDAFSVTVSASLSEDNDAQLFLFDADGFLTLSDDDGGDGLLPQFDPGELSGLSTGIYYLAFNLFDTEPNSNPLAGWDRDPSPFQTGPYTLSLTGTKFASSATVPEPSTILGLGVLGLGAFSTRKLAKAKKSNKQGN